ATAAAREMSDESVDEHVGRAGVESENLLRFGGARKNSDVGNTAEIERDSAKFCVAIEKIVGVWNERRALAAERDVRRAKIADGGDPRARGNDGGLSDLKRRGGWRTEIRNWMPLV